MGVIHHARRTPLIIVEVKSACLTHNANPQFSRSQSLRKMQHLVELHPLMYCIQLFESKAITPARYFGCCCIPNMHVQGDE